MRKIIISSLVLLLVGLMVTRIPSVNAGANDDLFGWAWSPVIGWISFNNCVYGGGCSGINYGVKLEPSGDYPLSGYAWNSNVGWILFEDSYPTSAQPQHGVQLDLATRKFSGWAKILALGDDGWIKLAKNSYDSGPDYWSQLNDDGKLAGWAWNNTIGWLSFNSNDVTSSITYYVTGKAPTIPSNVIVTPDDVDGCNTLIIDWQDSLYAKDYSVFRSTSASFTPSATVNFIASTTVSNFIDNNNFSGLSLNTDYYYHIGASNFFGTTYTTASAHGKTRPICGIDTITGEGDCLNGNPSVIKLNWQVPTVAPGTEIDHYQIKRCQIDDDPAGDQCLQNSPNFVEVANTSDCYQVNPTSPDYPPTPPSENHCVGINCHCWERFTGDEVARQYVYKIVAVDTMGNYGDDTATLINIYPCARQKSWRWEEKNPGFWDN
ncbi:MAG TPA: hypothetical protein PLX67_01250 [bacterium]|jgi:hypothetical protein|nr:hypothetical protein [bacterium]HNZ51642.1 hypothetical protein [bacterium]HOF79803.1 hypothetical protein [bacterium]HOH85648.1 hypothetical protein [bacterium]HOQ91936.1 hypothetical protein [bacterium]